MKRLDPANKSSAIHGFCDNDLQKRIDTLNKVLAANPGTCLSIRYDHVHKGKRDERMSTKVSVMEFASNSGREAVFKVLQKVDMKDNSGATFVCKRVKTGMQKQRNGILIKAEGKVNSAPSSDAVIKLDW